MKDFGGKLALICALLWTGLASGQVASPSPAGAMNVPELTPTPGATPAKVEVVTPAMSAPTPAAAGGTVTVTSGTFPMLTGTAPALSGTAPLINGTTGAALPSPTPASPYAIEIDLTHQRAYLLKDGKKLAEAPVSSGRAGHLTPVGSFEVIQKDLNHFSNLYGKIVEKGSGAVVKSGADVATPVPKGCKFVPAPMKWFLRFDGAAGMHAGILPGYPASHGCVRMPASKAQFFFQTVSLGTPVHVFGNPPVRAEHEDDEPRHRVAAAATAPAQATKGKPAPAAAAKATPPPQKKHNGWLFL